MASSSILGGSAVPSQASGTGTDALGPSDSSDSGSDVQGERPMATGPDELDQLGAVPADLQSTSDAGGTGERESAVSANIPDAPDIMPDRIIPASDAVLGDNPSDDVADFAAEAESLEDELIDDDAGERLDEDARAVPRPRAR